MKPAPHRAGLNRTIVVAFALTLAWFAILALLTADLVAHYFPLADEWALLADSHPSLAQPASWFTQGFGDYFLPPAGLPHEPGTPFLRPVFNLAYWLSGWVLPIDSGRYLYLSLAAIGASAGLAWIALCGLGVWPAPAFALSLAVPLLPSLAPALEPLLQPCMGFDVVAACACLLAYLAFTRARYLQCALWLLLAVFTKETALPIAVALPFAYVLRAGLAGLRDARLVGVFALLAAPIVLWLIARYLAFGLDESAQIYVMRSTGYDGLLRLLRLASKWPFWVDASQLLRAPGWSVDNVLRAAQLLANVVVMGAALWLIAAQLRRRQMPTVEQLCLLASYAFLLLVGTSPRYGVLLDLFLLLCLAQAWRARVGAWGATTWLASGLALGMSASVAQATLRWPVLEANTLRYAEVGRDYVAALKRADADTPVLVLNDPVTFWAPVEWLRQALGIQAPVIKLADYAWSSQLLGAIDQSCTVSLRELPGRARRYEFTQSCGIDLLSSTRELPADHPVRLQRERGVLVNLLPPSAPEPRSADRPRWHSLHIELPDAAFLLLYYDPATGRFETLAVDSPRAAPADPRQHFEDQGSLPKQEAGQR